MRQDIQKDIEMLNYLYNTINKSVFISINCNNFDILYYSDFYSQSEEVQNNDFWIWVKFVKNDKNKLYISEIFPNNKNKSIDIHNLKLYLNFLLRSFRYNLTL